MKPHKHLAIIVLALTGTAGTVRADVSSHPCMMALAQGSLEERRAQFSQALALFEQARKEPVCEIEAQIGMARTFNSMNDHKDAVIAAEWVLDHSDDPELLAEAQYEIGRALHKPGRRMTADKTAAAEAYLQAVELSEGRHRGAVRALMRLYEETRQEDRLAEIQERYPDIRASTRARQVRTVTPKKKNGPAAGKPGPVVAQGSADCSTREAAPAEDWELDLPRFCGSGPDQETGRQPRKLSSPTPEYPEEDRKARTQGTVKFEALVGTDGEVEAVRIVEGVSPGLDAATIASACQWRWEPAEGADGQPSRFYICGTTSFRVQ
ncbi:MAG: TonB family protein [Thermoanaerobaculia bacterium]